MQKNFLASNNKFTIKNCKKLIKKALNDNAPILFVEYRGYDSTNKKLLNVIKNNKKYYSNIYVVKKSEDNGASDISKFVDSYNLPKNFVICGVNTSFCITKTIIGLSEKYPNSKIKFVKKASNCITGIYHESGSKFIAGISDNIFVK